MLSRHFLRQKAVQACFNMIWQLDEGKLNLEEEREVYLPQLELILQRVWDREIDDKEEESYKFTQGLLVNTFQDWTETKETISLFLKEKLDRLPNIDKALLFTGVAEMRHPDPGVNHLIIINEYVELSKEFSSENAPKLINGVLHSVKEHLKN